VIINHWTVLSWVSAEVLFFFDVSWNVSVACYARMWLWLFVTRLLSRQTIQLFYHLRIIAGLW